MKRSWIEDVSGKYIYKKQKRSAGLKAAATAGFLFGIGATVAAYITKKKSDEYRDALIEMSDMLPDEDEEQILRDNWRSNHAPENRKTVEERLEEQMITESE